MWTFARWGGAFTPLLVIFVFRYMNWREAFYLFGAIGVIWAVAFYWWYRDNPRDHKSVNQAELALLKGADQMASGHGDVPWDKLLVSRTVWLLWLQYFCLSFPWYFYITWLPTYLQEARHLTPDQTADYAKYPLLFGGFGSLFCGLISKYVERWTGSVRTSRRMLACLGFFGAGCFLILSINTGDAFWAMIAMGMASFCNDLVMPGAWGTCMDVGGKYAGTLSGSMNMMGNMAGFVAPTFGGWLVQRYGGDWNPFLYVMAAVYFLGTACWPLIDTTTTLESLPYSAARFRRVMTTLAAAAGGLAGGAIAFFFMPPGPSGQRLPLSAVLTRGSMLEEAESLLTPIAVTSFNYLLAGILVGVLVGATVYLTRAKRTTAGAAH
jgi:sugar phosphate permease